MCHIFQRPPDVGEHSAFRGDSQSRRTKEEVSYLYIKSISKQISLILGLVFDFFPCCTLQLHAPFREFIIPRGSRIKVITYVTTVYIFASAFNKTRFEQVKLLTFAVGKDVLVKSLKTRISFATTFFLSQLSKLDALLHPFLPKEPKEGIVMLRQLS